ncbi:phosphoenolpyruvate-utilizing N-terminal domain-containing protein [Mycoplasmatota bacterium WC30]
MRFLGQVISEGIAYGKVGFIEAKYDEFQSANNDSNQLNIFQKSIELSTKKLDKEIVTSKDKYTDRISEIFETHKYIVNDPLVKNRTIELIKSNHTASMAYAKAINEILDQFNKIDNEYMLGRIVDIIDATDRVKSVLNCITEQNLNDYKEPTILILKNLKPSIIYSSNNSNIKGFISNEGYYNQHSGIIARTIKMPGIVCENLIDNIKPDDYVLIDCYKGEIIINPSKIIIRDRIEGGL